MSDEDIYKRYADVCARANAQAERLFIVEAERVALIAMLSEIIAYTESVGGFMTAENQATLWRARALLAEVLR